RQEAFFGGLLIPWLRIRIPVLCPVARAAELRWIDGWLVVLIIQVQRRDRNVAAFVYTSALGLVGEDLTDQGLQGRSTFELIDAFEHCQPGFLHHFFGNRVIRYMCQRETDQGCMIAIQQGRECRLVPVPQSLAEGPFSHPCACGAHGLLLDLRYGWGIDPQMVTK